MVGASAVVLAQYAFTHPWSGLLVSPELLTLSVILALGATVVPSYLMSAALSRISAQANSTIGTLSPVVTLLLAVLILGEPIRLVDVIGTALVIAGLALFTLVERRG
jgi:drug/metabolite transporter (DMT)-like permease